MAPSSAGRSCAPTAARSTSTSIQITWSRSTRSWPSRTRARHSPSKTRDLHEPPPAPPLPDGFRLRTVEPDDLPARVDVHRDIWAPSRVTEESYANVMQTWPYRASLDCVVEAADGGFAAYALLWPDDVNRVGELEPVGTRAEFRGLGLGAAVCTYALRRWHDEGGRQAIVYCLTEPVRALYRAVGFECHSCLTAYKRG